MTIPKTHRGLFCHSKRLYTSLLMLSMASASIYAGNAQASASYQPTSKPSNLITRAEAANPNNFKFINVNGRTATYASAPCPVETGLIACGLQKLHLINGGAAEVDADYDLAQTFLFPSKSQPGVAVVIITRSGLMDDSVSAERYRISFKSEEKPLGLDWNWVQYGVQYKCARGDNAGQWTKSLCP